MIFDKFFDDLDWTKDFVGECPHCDKGKMKLVEDFNGKKMFECTICHFRMEFTTRYNVIVSALASVGVVLGFLGIFALISLIV